MTTWPSASTPWTWKTDFAMSRPIVVTVCMDSSSESWEPQQRPHPWHSRAGWRSRPQHQKLINAGQQRDLLKHCIGPGEQRIRHRNAQCPGGLHIETQVYFCRLFDWQLARFRAFQDTVHIG